MASTAPQDNGGSLRKSIGLIELFTFWTCEPIRPAQAFQIGSAGGIIGKNPLKIGKRCWKAAGVHSGKLSPIHRIGNKPDRQETDHATLDTLNPAFRQSFDNISPVTIMNDRYGTGATGGTRLRPALARGAGLRRNSRRNRDKLLPRKFVRLHTASSTGPNRAWSIARILPHCRKSGFGAERKCWHGSLPAAIGGIPESICSLRAFLILKLCGSSAQNSHVPPRIYSQGNSRESDHRQIMRYFPAFSTDASCNAQAVTIVRFRLISTPQKYGCQAPKAQGEIGSRE